MNSEKLVMCEISSEENDQQEEAQDDTAGTKRSYECTFCKRGFTNAQALGGHMNIHRKDRAKEKQVTLNSSLPHKYFTNEESMTPAFASGFSNQSTGHYSILEYQRNFDMHFHPPALNLRNQPAPAYAHDFQYDQFHNPRFRPMNLNQDQLRGANLSLQIGPSNVDNNTHQIRRGTHNDNEVDLELRLGHHPY